MYSEKNHQCSFFFFLKFYFKTKEFNVMHQSYHKIQRYMNTQDQPLDLGA